jgi:hypothetical protein
VIRRFGLEVVTRMDLPDWSRQNRGSNSQSKIFLTSLFEVFKLLIPLIKLVEEAAWMLLIHD